MAKRRKNKKEKLEIKTPKRNYEHFEHQQHVTGTGYHGIKKYSRKRKHKGREDY